LNEICFSTTSNFLNMNSRDLPSYNKHVDFSFSKNFPKTQVLKLINAFSQKSPLFQTPMKIETSLPTSTCFEVSIYGTNPRNQPHLILPTLPTYLPASNIKNSTAVNEHKQRITDHETRRERERERESINIINITNTVGPTVLHSLRPLANERTAIAETLLEFGKRYSTSISETPRDFEA